MNGDDLAFPRLDESYKNRDGEFSHSSVGGLTKRELFAAMAMQTICAGPGARMVADRDGRYNQTNWKEVVAMNSVEFADALIAELSKEAIPATLDNELRTENEKLKHALSVVLPMAKGYAAEHQVGRNNEIVRWAEFMVNGTKEATC